MIDVVRFVMREAPRVTRANAHRMNGVDRAMDVELQVPSGATVKIGASILAFRPPGTTVTIVGSDHTLQVLNPITPHISNLVRLQDRQGKLISAVSIKGATTYDYQLEAFQTRTLESRKSTIDIHNLITNLNVVDSIRDLAGLSAPLALKSQL